jgi:hypothetical protein
VRCGSAMLSILVGLVLATISGCADGSRSGGGFGGMPGSLGAGCVDTTGPNSTPEQIVDAALAASTTNPVTGQQITVSEKFAQKRAPFSETAAAAEFPGEDGYRRFVDGVFTDVPAGGDAAFAAAVCRLPDWDLRNGSYLYNFGVTPTSDSDKERVAKTPHLLRGFGRQECNGRSGDPEAWEKEVQQLEQDVQRAKLDPENYKRSALAEVDEQIAASADYGAFNPRGVDQVGLAMARASRERISATPAEELVDQLAATSQMSRLAIEYQCPQFR